MEYITQVFFVFFFEKYAQNPKKPVPFLISSLKNLLFCPFFNEIENLNHFLIATFSLKSLEE